MARQQLDLDAPLLSVRRRSSAKLPSPPGRLNKINDQKPLSYHQKSLPSPKSDWELTDVTKPGAVPFLWEQSPGRPKPGSESPVEPSNTPRLPPGRARGTPKFLSGEVHQNQNLPRSKFLSGDQNLRIHQNAAPPIGDISALLESLNREVYGEEGYDSEKDEEYTDALETLSTYSMNCSTSGRLSGKSSTYFSSDRQTREFVMSRFLPAAKAVAANTPLKKQSSASPVRSRPVSKEMIVPVRKPLFERQKSGSVGSHGHSSQNNESEDEDDDEYDNSGKVSMKTRGFFSRFCLKNSLCLINPVPMMKVRTQAPAAPVKGVNRLARTAQSGPLTQMEDKSSEATVYKQKLHSGARSQEFHTVKTKPNTLESPRLSYSGDLRMARGPSPNRSFNRGEISPRQKESSRSPYRRGVAKDAENNNSVIRPQHFPVVTRHKPFTVSGPIIPVTEKILYMDSVKNAERSPNFSSRRMNDGGVAAEPFKQDLKASKSPISQADRMENLRLDLTRLRDNARNGRRNSEQRPLKEDDNAPPSFGFSFSVQPPPLPSSPSESWLWRTLPSIPLRDPKKQKHWEAPDTGGATWETIVKTSNVHFDHVRYSEELVPRVPQH